VIVPWIASSPVPKLEQNKNERQRDSMTNSPPSSEFYRPRIGKAARAGHLIVCKCNFCRRSVVYLAIDLVEIYHKEMFLEDLFGGRCPRCGKSDFWSVRERSPSTADVGMLKVRRPAGVRRIQLWRDELYSAPAKF
jgi:hypothetical protein